MSDSIARDNLDSLLPTGNIWQVEQDSDSDKLLDGMAENSDEVINFVNELLPNLRNPDTTILLDELLQEHGLYLPVTYSELQKREILKSKMFSKNNAGTLESLQDALNEAGFTDVYVYANDPANDPALFTTQNYQMVCGDPLNAFCDDPGAYVGVNGGYLLANGVQYTQTPHILMTCDDLQYSFCGDPESFCDNYDELDLHEILYTPGDTCWPLYFFIGGSPVTRDINGKIIDVPYVQMSANLRPELERIILQFKPLFTWGIIMVLYI
jgi:hypothetical protein